MTLSAASRSEIQGYKARYPEPRSAVLPSLWVVQHELGYLPVPAMREIAGILGLEPSEVQAVATFYSMFLDKPAGEHSVVVCRNVSCALRGADELAAHVERTLGCPSGGTTSDGQFTWESTVECLGACGGAPAIQVDHRFHENVTPEVMDAILGRSRSQPAPSVGGESEAASTKQRGEPKTAPRAKRTSRPKRAHIDPGDL